MANDEVRQAIEEAREVAVYAPPEERRQIWHVTDLLARESERADRAERAWKESTRKRIHEAARAAALEAVVRYAATEERCQCWHDEACDGSCAHGRAVDCLAALDTGRPEVTDE